MDSLLDDDICILTHEKEDITKKRDGDAPFSVSSGEASVASHFALVTAYEDIKKRLQDTERENYTLKKRLRQMEEKEKEKIDSTKYLNEQLQAKEVELLQVKSELETHQVMKSLSKTPTDWEIEKLNSELKIRSVEQELKLLQEECGRLRAELQRTKSISADHSLLGDDCYQAIDKESERSMREAYWELQKEMSNLHLVTEVQEKVLRKLKGTVAATKKAAHGPVQCEEDLVKTVGRLRITATGVTYEKSASGSSNESSLGEQIRGINIPQEKTGRMQWTSERPSPVGGRDCDEFDSYQRSPFDENSWVIPSPPKPSETLFWETKNNSSPNNTGHFYNPKYKFKS
ncbi:5-azacytidine-induced protein 2 isoform X2 [Hyperolius riggenbachi]|uniref:5-azacytidine-induced protein 2 isoform X2 n=1 Tax=Hyperolius riggenbachi TaxID=752182 RepID=UPI0035A39509